MVCDSGYASTQPVSTSRTLTAPRTGATTTKGPYPLRKFVTMNILFVGLARTIWLFDFRLVNPTGMSLRGVIEEIGKRHQFATAPKNELDFDEQRSLAFKAGTFVGARGVPALVALNIYADGIVADTMSSTDESGEFLVDLAKWLDQTYGLTVPKQRTVNFLSQIDFEWEPSLGRVNPRLQEFAKSIAPRMDATDARPRDFEVAAINFWTEDFGRPATPAPVKIERKISAPFSANHFFSQAPLSTNRHIQLLNEFESLLKER